MAMDPLPKSIIKWKVIQFTIHLYADHWGLSWKKSMKNDDWFGVWVKVVRYNKLSMNLIIKNNNFFHFNVLQLFTSTFLYRTWFPKIVEAFIVYLTHMQGKERVPILARSSFPFFLELRKSVSVPFSFQTVKNSKSIGAGMQDFEYIYALFYVTSPIVIEFEHIWILTPKIPF